MDLIFTNAKRVDQGVLHAYTLDLSFGAEENDFELTLGANEPVLEFSAFAYIEGTEYGGIVDGMKSSTNGETITYTGRTWHGIMDAKVLEPNAGDDYLIVSGDAHSVLSNLITRVGLGSLFKVVEGASGINITNHQFARYCPFYGGVRGMLAEYGAKLKIEWKDRAVYLSAVPIVDYTEAPVDGDLATLTVEQYANKVNHLVCLGKGELADREVIHLYVDQFGRIGNVQYYTGLDEIMTVYDNTAAESSEALRKEAIDHLTELVSVDVAEVNVPEADGLTYDIGDTLGAADMRSGVRVAATVTQKIVKINNGVVSTEYQTGG